MTSRYKRSRSSQRLRSLAGMLFWVFSQGSMTSTICCIGSQTMSLESIVVINEVRSWPNWPSPLALPSKLFMKLWRNSSMPASELPAACAEAEEPEAGSPSVTPLASEVPSAPRKASAMTFWKFSSWKDLTRLLNNASPDWPSPSLSGPGLGPCCNSLTASPVLRAGCSGGTERRSASSTDWTPPRESLIRLSRSSASIGTVMCSQGLLR
mmetsp:Transcript_50993/g.110645  ORF Transcript_50993/g.110645 Transcript_50993/m.110645 type:complete len:210 (+) Transcript_50993:531-1160(+)